MQKLYTKLYAIQQLALAVSKDGKNPHFKSAYPTLDNVIEVLTPVLNKNGILVTHFAENDTFVTRVVDTESGEVLDSRYTMLGTTPQQRGSEQTYFRRYSMIALFNLPSEDDDGNIASNNAPIRDDVPQVPKVYPKSRGDEILEEITICEDLGQLQTYHEELMKLAKSDKQKAFYNAQVTKEKKRIQSNDIHEVFGATSYQDTLS